MRTITVPIDHTKRYYLEEYSSETRELSYAWVFDTLEEVESELLRQIRINGHKSMYSMFHEIKY